ncbi:MAG: zinc ribbon domain-containing protein [Dehalococcoidia bacterium]|nr:zinc ribbon domain-containing protein [Dehalococcoidia bacterium]
MPLYEYYCPPCGTRFELLRPASQMNAAASCPSGHTTNNRVISLFAPVARSSSGGAATLTATDMSPSAGACCSTGGGCSCC